ncbi:MAG: CHASE3 domain-containing protein [Steroidobacteraceae bacterium]
MNEAQRIEQSWLARVGYLSPALLLLLTGILITSIATLVLSEIIARAALRDGLGIDQVTQRLQSLAQWKELLVDAETAERGFLLGGDASQLAPFDGAQQNLSAAVSRTTALVPEHSPLRAAIEKMSTLSSRALAVEAETIALATDGKFDEAITLMRAPEGRRIMDQFRRELASVHNASYAELAQLRDAQRRGATGARFVLIFSTIISLALLFISARQFVAEATRQRNLRAAAEYEARHLQKIVAERTAELSQLSGHLQEASEREKSQLARILHDQLGGLLTAAKMDVSWLHGRVASDPNPEVRQKLAALDSELGEAMSLKRRVVENLRPALLDHFGLPTAMQAFFDETCRHAKLQVSTLIPEEIASVPPDAAIALFRVGQEALDNIVSHAKAKHVDLVVESDADFCAITIADDGIGMDLSDPRFMNSHGISGMRHRITRLGGELMIDSAPGKGTRLLITIPKARLSAGEA